MEKEADYKEMYLHLMRETEKAVRVLTEAQRQCEALYLDTTEPDAGLPAEQPTEDRAEDRTEERETAMA